MARVYPLVAGIDLAGEVVASDDDAFPVGSKVVANGYDIGTARHGGFGELARIPSDWAVPLPRGLTTRDAMAIGTAGFTAAMSVDALERHGLKPGEGPVLVTGAAGGVGSTAIAILAARGHEAWAATGKPDEVDRLRDLGATGFLTRDEVTAPGRPLDAARWAGAVDTVGSATLPYVLRTLRLGGAVASSGNAWGAELSTTVFPFILRGVACSGWTARTWRSARDGRSGPACPTTCCPRGIEDGITEVHLDTLEPALDAIADGEARGRWVVRVS